MRKKITSIPINTMDDNPGADIFIDKISLDEATLNNFEGGKESHREDRHSFFLLESGTVHIEIDFQQFTIKAPSIVYMHPNQVHRIMSVENIIVSSWAINNENLHPFIEEVQEAAVKFGLEMLVPTTEEAIRERNTKGDD